jgi:hypothetical protein
MKPSHFTEGFIVRNAAFFTTSIPNRVLDAGSAIMCECGRLAASRPSGKARLRLVQDAAAPMMRIPEAA